jgi:small subunit ribosomal protein S6
MSTRKYELVYVVTPDASDEQVTALHDQVQAIVGRFGAEIEKTENWGRRKLAYEIGHHKEGTYVLEVINGGGDLMKEIDRRLKVTDEVIRHIVVRVDEEQRVADRARTRRTATQQRRRIARGLPPEVQEGEKRREGEDRDEGGFDEAGV